MNQTFDRTYADSYDFLYQEKNYSMECDLIESIIQRYHNDRTVRKILDLGCGTGNHAIPLAQRGYEVTGIDRSPMMLAHAREKAYKILGKDRISFQEGDIRQVDQKQQYDVVIMMFAVLGYQISNEEVLAALQVARQHLKDNGLFIFDTWYGPTVLLEGPGQRVKLVPTPHGSILRVASGELNVTHHTCTVQYHLWNLEKDRVVASVEEKHTMRFFFPLELQFFLKAAGFSLIRLGQFPDFDRDPDHLTWNILGAAKAI